MAIAKVPANVMVPDPVTGPPLVVRPVVPPLTLMLVTVPPPVKAAQVPSPRQKVVLLAPEPPPKLVTGKFPVTPVVSGKPVALVKVKDVGVPNDPLYVTKPPDALVALPNAVKTPVPAPVKPVEIGRPVTFDITPDTGVPSAGETSVGKLERTTEPAPVEVVTPVPPLATFNVPLRTTAPDVGVEGVNPVVPALNDELFVDEAQMNDDPFHSKYVGAVVGAVINDVAPEPV